MSRWVDDSARKENEMRIGVLGTGGVGQTLATKLVELGHEVKMGSREAGNEKAVAWVAEAGDGASEGAFADAAGFGEVVVNATAGVASVAALQAAGAENLSGKLLLDVSNPLDFSGGMPPKLSVCNDDSLAEQIQAAFPEARVVKSLNTVNAGVMVEPGEIPESTIFVAGNDDAAKSQVVELLESFGWPRDDVVDLGDITGARAMEMYLPMWLRLFTVTGTPKVSVKVVRG
jgi:8-hydroxy-5-deazaflavin:NADPH oxidoreductase